MQLHLSSHGVVFSKMVGVFPALLHPVWGSQGLGGEARHAFPFAGC